MTHMDIFIDKSFESYYRKQPLVLVDVGSSGGIQDRWKRFEKYIHVIGFEPDQRSYEDLVCNSAANPNAIYINMGLADKKGAQELYLTRTKTDSSLLKPNRIFLDRFPLSQRFDIVGTSTIALDTMDNQLDMHGIKDVDFIKLDTQGTELPILQGGKNVITDLLFGLEVEVEFVPFYENQYLFTDVDQFMRPIGFELFDLFPVFWRRKIGKGLNNSRGQIIFGDAVYLRERENFRNMISAIKNKDAQKSKVLRALSVCLAYDFFDYGLEILDACRDVFSVKEVSFIDDKIRQGGTHKTRVPSHFPGRQKIADAFQRLSGHFHQNIPNWAIRRFK